MTAKLGKRQIGDFVIKRHTDSLMVV
jgi:hypothetical protein